jgi:GT2 family glycosyltransferase/glycosyltransferase involved in cell wall biosynthesis
LATERLIAVEHPLAVVGTLERKAIDIIVPVYKSVQLTTRCLNSLADQIQEIASSNPRLIVINDSPDEPDVREMLEAFAKRHSYVTVLENESNLGFVKSVNKGLEIACKAGRDVILVNADTETFTDTLKNLVDAAYSDPQIGFASPRSNNASICSLPHFYGGTVADQTESYERWKVLSRTMPAFHFTPTAVGFYLYIKHVILANFGFLDPEFGLGYEEENDLILRANKVGYRAVMVNNAFAFHAGSASFSLLDMNLTAHQGANLQKMAQRHTEFLPLVRRYEGSAHFRAEALLSHILPTTSGRLKLVFDLSSVGPNFNGTNEMAMAIIDGLYERHSSTFEFNAICSVESFKFHKLDRLPGLRRHDTEHRTTEKFAIGIQLGQPFSVHAISVLEDIAVINIFGMLDTIGEDCGYLSITHQLESLWGHIARHANGMFFNSKFSEQCVIARYPDANNLSRYARLLPTSLSSYRKELGGPSAGEHVLIMGNHFAHKASDRAAEILKAAFPTIQFVVLGKENGLSRNVRTYRAGTLGDEQMESLYTRASIVVLPSHVEGFGLGFVHALAARKVVVARDIPATREILSAYKDFSGVLLYRDDSDIVPALKMAMKERQSEVNDEGADTWDAWADGFARFCLQLLQQDDLFERVVRRIQAGDLLRKVEMFDRLQTAAPALQAAAVEGSSAKVKSGTKVITDEQGRKWRPAKHVKELLDLNDEEFVYGAYVTLFNRLPDSDGLVNYLAELQSGVSKLDIVSRLRQSTEGRRYARALSGYRALIMKAKLTSLLGLSASRA